MQKEYEFVCDDCSALEYIFVDEKCIDESVPCGTCGGDMYKTFRELDDDQ